MGGRGRGCWLEGGGVTGNQVRVRLGAAWRQAGGGRKGKKVARQDEEGEAGWRRAEREAGSTILNG